jgi:hypothetical protein
MNKRFIHGFIQDLNNVKVQLVSVVLALISIGAILGPVGAVVIIYRADLSQLVIPPQIREIMNGNSSIIPTGNSDNQDDNSGMGGGLMKPVFVSAQSNPQTNSFTGIFQVTNPLNYDVTLNSFGATVAITQNQIPGGDLSLASPVTIPAGQTTQITITGHWTQEIENYFANNPAITSVEVYVSNVRIDINGIVIESSGTIDVGNIPMNTGQ